MPLCGLLAIDGHGENHLVFKEDEVALRKMLMAVQEYNHNRTKMQTVVTDKDCVKRTVFKPLMPAVSL